MEALPFVLTALGLAIALVALVGWRHERARGRAAASARERENEEFRRTLEASEDDRRSASQILSAMTEGVLLFGADGTTRFANPAVERHLGWSPASMEALLPHWMKDAAATARATREVTIVEVETGSPTRVLRGAALPTPDGSVVLVLDDVTQTRRLEQTRRDFVSNASHELKTPAASIQAAAETIRIAASEDPSVVPRFAAQLEREAARLARIVSDLLDLSRLETGSELDESVALDAVVRDESERFEDSAAEAGVALDVTAPRVPRVRGSGRDLALLVRNLVDNAIRYTRPGGRVEVGLGSHNGDVILTVLDTGLGIPTRDVSRIFERFYRVDRARSRETGGTGLGLSIVKHVVENHGGTIDVSSQLGEGTRVEVRLPAAAP
ncbi:MAG TPA: ATP-binding protein [Actinomycetota bacterium]|nr:ATP-binding protein [Actinomycetota bacterium]